MATRNKLSKSGKTPVPASRFAEAEQLFREALTILDGRTKVPDQLALLLNDLAMSRANQRAFADAVPLLERAVAIDEASPDPGSKEAVRRLRNYAAVLLAAGRGNDSAAAALRATALEQGQRPTVASTNATR